MKKYGAYLALGLILAATVYTVSLRLGVLQYGRQVPVLDLSGRSDLPEPLRLRTLGDRERAGDLSLIRGRTIYEFFRAQIPAVPLLSTQASRLNVDPHHTYIITSSRMIFERVKALLPGVRVYESRGIAYDGIRYPGAFVLESARSPAQLAREPVGPLPPVESAGAYLLLETDREVELFFRGTPPERPLNVILPDGRALAPSRAHHEFLRVLSSIYVLGQNAVRSSPTDPVDGEKLHLLSGPPEVPYPWFRGHMEPPGPLDYWVSLALLILGALLLVYREEDRLFRWGFWAALLVVAGFLGPVSVPLQGGLVVAGLVQLAYRREARVAWLFLGVTIFFGFCFQGHHLNPLAASEGALLGLVLGGALLIPSPDILSYRLTLGELLLIGLGIGLLGILWTHRREFPFTLDSQLTLGLLFLYPYLPRFSEAFENCHRWAWFVGLTGWCLLLTRPVGWLLLSVTGGCFLVWFLVGSLGAVLQNRGYFPLY